MEMDLDRHCVTFFKNGQEMWTFTELAAHVIPFVNFGEPNQKIGIRNLQSDFGKIIYY